MVDDVKLSPAERLAALNQVLEDRLKATEQGKPGSYSNDDLMFIADRLVTNLRNSNLWHGLGDGEQIKGLGTALRNAGNPHEDLENKNAKIQQDTIEVLRRAMQAAGTTLNGVPTTPIDRAKFSPNNFVGSLQNSMRQVQANSELDIETVIQETHQKTISAGTQTPKPFEGLNPDAIAAVTAIQSHSKVGTSNSKTLSEIIKNPEVQVLAKAAADMRSLLEKAIRSRAPNISDNDLRTTVDTVISEANKKDSTTVPIQRGGNTIR